MLHFVGFRSEEFNSAVKVWGEPDFFHRVFDDRVVHSGEIDWDTDTVVFANSAENKHTKWTFNDSEVF